MTSREDKNDRSNKTIFCLIRHAVTAWNAEGRIQGHTDIDLSPAGMEQAQKMANKLAGERFDAIYTSDLKRACQTARELAKTTGAELRVRQDLRERNWGALEGMTWVEVAERRPQDLARIYGRDIGFAPEGGESKGQIYERIVGAFFEIAEEERGKRIAIVSHGGTLTLLVKHMMGINIASRTPFAIDNCSITWAELRPDDDDLCVVTSLNDAAHLKKGDPALR